MKLRGSPAAFSVLFCIAYVVVFVMERPMFRYYPVPRQWAWGVADDIDRPGPVMVWYGLVASAAAIAAIGAIVVPQRWLADRLQGRLWVWPWAAVLACGYLLRPLFLA